MSSKFEAPSFDELVAEQQAVQAEKFQGRTLAAYSNYLFEGQMWHEPMSCAVTDFVRPYCSEERITLDGVLRGLSEAKQDEPLHWVDMGGGRGLPMRELGNIPQARERLRMTNVDLFDYGLEGLEPSEIDALERLSPGMTGEHTKPQLIRADVETVVLPEPADVVTSVEVMQYLNNPLAAICNWYNQLADNGLLFITTERDWPSWIRHYGPGGADRDEPPTKALMDTLSNNDIRFAATKELDWPNRHRPKLRPDEFTTMVIQKKPGTQLQLCTPVVEIWTNMYHFKAVYYKKPAKGLPLIEVQQV